LIALGDPSRGRCTALRVCIDGNPDTQELAEIAARSFASLRIALVHTRSTWVCRAIGRYGLAVWRRCGASWKGSTSMDLWCASRRPARLPWRRRRSSSGPAAVTCRCPFAPPAGRLAGFSLAPRSATGGAIWWVGWWVGPSFPFEKPGPLEPDPPNWRREWREQPI
jgi:hypothetical protein